MAKNFRLYIKEELNLNKNVSVDENQAHYLRNVVKYSVGDELYCFDNKKLGAFFNERAFLLLRK
jgi:16S rRNA U1498 N3-methylase RsmE